MNLDRIEIIQFSLKIYDLLRHTHLWAGVWVAGQMGRLIDGSMGGVRPNLINLDLIKIIQFCLKIDDLLRHSHIWVGQWLVAWMGGLMGGSMDNVKSNH